MTGLQYQGENLFFENKNLKECAETFGTPLYVYAKSIIEKNWHAYHQAFSTVPHEICYAVKANSNIAILNLLAKCGSGFDIVSVGELERVLAAGGDITKVVFSGVGKTALEIERALQAGLFCFDVESLSELKRLQSMGEKLNRTVPIAFRINPHVDAKTHSYISTGHKENKFGIEIESILQLLPELKSMNRIKLMGLACHIGSQLMTLEPLLMAIDKLVELYFKCKAVKMPIEYINVGGGLGVCYRDETPPSIQDYARAIQKKLSSLPVKIILEPGRAIMANAGILLTRVEYIKRNQERNFAIIDAGMNDLIRPALYEAWQPIMPIVLRSQPKENFDIAGPVCESADFLGKNRLMSLEENDLLAIGMAGAYGFSMSSNYNSRGRAAEVLIDGEKIHLIRRRETIQDSLALEAMI